MGMKPMEAINSVYIVNGSTNIWGKAITRRLREHGYSIKYLEEDDDHCVGEVRKRTGDGKNIPDEVYTETFYFKDAEKSGWTNYKGGGLKVGWLPGQNRKLKMRYGVLSSIIKSYIPDVLGSATDIAEVAEDVVIDIPEESAEKSGKKVDVTTPKNEVEKQDSLRSFIAQKKEEAEEGEIVESEPEVTPKTDSPEEDEGADLGSHPTHSNPAALNHARKEFFAVAREAGLDGEEAKKAAKVYYGVESLKDLSVTQIKLYTTAMRRKIETNRTAMQEEVLGVTGEEVA